MCTSRLTLNEKKLFHLWRNASTESMHCHIKGQTPITWITQFEWIELQLELFHTNAFSHYIYQETLSQPSFMILQTSTMDASQCWPFTHEYSIWNSTVSRLQFWTAGLKPHVLTNATDQVYTAFFYSTYTQEIQHLPEETLWCSNDIVLILVGIHAHVPGTLSRDPLSVCGHCSGHALLSFAELEMVTPGTYCDILPQVVWHVPMLSLPGDNLLKHIKIELTTNGKNKEGQLKSITEVKSGFSI